MIFGTLACIDARRTLPSIDWTTVIVGVAVAALIAIVIGIWLASVAPPFAVAAPVCGVAGGAFLAGKRASRAPAYHGALVGVGYVLLEAVGLVPPLFAVRGDDFAESVAIIGSDAALLALATLFGWLASRRRPSSSLDTGRGR